MLSDEEERDLGLVNLALGLAKVERLHMRAQLERSRALLKRIEWRGGSGDCPDCCGWNDAGGKHHKPDCELAALLRAKRGA